MFYLVTVFNMSLLAKTLKNIAKKHGEGTAMLFKDMGNVEVQRISSGLPSLDFILGGWIPLGRIMEIYWPSSSGKTTLAVKMLAEFQKAFPNKKVAFIDVEHALDPNYARAVWLDVDNIVFSQPNSAEEALDVMEALTSTWEVSCIVLDSVAKLVPRKEVEGDMGVAEMWMRARLMGQGLRKITPVANKNLCTCIFINQVRQSVWVTYWNPEVRPWWQALPFDASVIIRTSSKKIDEKTGVTKMKINKNKVWIPFKETEVIISYGKGYDVLQDTITIAKTLGIIERAGAYYSFGEHKWRWETEMRNEVSSNEELVSEIKKAIASADTNIELDKKEVDTKGLMDSVVSELEE